MPHDSGSCDNCGNRDAGDISGDRKTVQGTKLQAKVHAHSICQRRWQQQGQQRMQSYEQIFNT